MVQGKYKSESSLKNDGLWYQQVRKAVSTALQGVPKAVPTSGGGGIQCSHPEDTLTGGCGGVHSGGEVDGGGEGDGGGVSPPHGTTQLPP